MILERRGGDMFKYSYGAFRCAQRYVHIFWLSTLLKESTTSPIFGIPYP